MPSLSEEVTIPSPVAAVWPLLADPALVATCIPGASLTATEISGVYHGTVRVRFGPTVVTFRGEARIGYHPDTLSCTIDGRGIAGRESRANASGVVHVTGRGNDTLVQVEGNFTVTGPLETIAHAGAADVARALLAEFSHNVVKLITTEGDPAPEAEAIPLVEPQTPTQQARAVAAGLSGETNVPEPSDSRGGAVLWRAVLLWLKQVFDRQRAPR